MADNLLAACLESHGLCSDTELADNAMAASPLA